MANTLFLGLGNHWEPYAPTGLPWHQNWNFGSGIDLSYRWWTQGSIRVRPGRRYPETGHPDQHTGGHLAYVKCWDAQFNYVDDPSQWRFVYNGIEEASYETGSPLLAAWLAATLAQFNASLASDPILTPRIHQLDDETIHTGWIWGRRGQSNYCEHYRHATRELIQAHTDLVMPFKAAFVDGLRAALPNDLFCWYNIPFVGNKQPPYDGGWWAEAYEPPISSDTEVDAADYRQILTSNGFMDCHMYLNSPDRPMHTTQRRQDWFAGQIDRRRAILTAALASFGGDSPPVIDKILCRNWLYNPPSIVYPDGTRWTDLSREFFEVLVDKGEENASIDGGSSPFQSWAAAEGYDPGTYFRTFIRQPAIDAGFLEDPGGVIGPISLFVAGITPSTIYRGQTAILTVTGGGFTDTTTASISGSGVSVVSETLSGTSLQVIVTVGEGASTGARDLTITRGATSFVLPSSIQVEASVMVDPLTVTGIEPDEVNRGFIETVQMTGTGFVQGMLVLVSAPGITVNSTSVISSTQALVQLSVSSGSALGPVTITVITPGEDGQTFTAVGLLSVIQPETISVEPTMSAERYDLTRENDHTIDQGATLVLQVRYNLNKEKTVQKDLTGYTARMQIRDEHDSAAAILEVNTEGVVGDKVTLGGALGTIVIEMSQETTAALPAPFKGVYDLYLYKDGRAERFMEGRVLITPRVTR